MKLSCNDLFVLNQCAVSAAYKAGAIISKYSEVDLVVKNKKAGESEASKVVTEVDLLSQEIILETVFPTLSTFDLGLLSEERIDDSTRFEKDFFWCIDPLDGTLPFIEFVSGFSVSIALVSKSGVPHIGVIYDPTEKTLYNAVVGNGAFRNGDEFILKSSNISKEVLTVILDRSFVKHSKFESRLKVLKSIAAECGYKDFKIVSHGGAAMNACWVLENAPALYLKLPKSKEGGGSLWDFAATATIFSELGAWVSDINGNALDLNRKESTFMNHNGVLYSSDSELSKKIVKASFGS